MTQPLKHELHRSTKTGEFMIAPYANLWCIMGLNALSSRDYNLVSSNSKLI